MSDYTGKSFGRHQEVDALYQMFRAGRDVTMPGPRRLGKTFLLERLVEAADRHGWFAVKVEVAGCGDSKAVFRELCKRIGQRRSGGQQAIDWFKQRLSQVLEPRTEAGGPWYQPFLSLDHGAHFERLISAMHDDPVRPWLLLIDELPIFLKALHDKGPSGVAEAREFMNLISRLRANYPKVRWLITGSIGIEPLAVEGQYLGVLAKFTPFELLPLQPNQAYDFVQDLARRGQLPHRQQLTDAEAQVLTQAVGWRAAYYLEALAQKMQGPLCESEPEARMAVEQALERLLQPSEMVTFGPWEEHLRKHYREPDRSLAFALLHALALQAQGTNLDGLLAALARPDLSASGVRQLLARLHVDGFLNVEDWDNEQAFFSFRNPLLRRWWRRFQPKAAV